jgi:hypothetical protein
MPNDTLRANAQAMPIDRRLFLASGTAAAVFGALHTAKAESADAELIALARKAKALYAALKAAEDASWEAEQRLGPDVIPEALIVTASDKRRFPRIKADIGGRFLTEDISVLRMVREVMLDMCRLVNWDDLGPNPDAPQMMARAVEVEKADAKHRSEREARRRAAGLIEAEREVDRLDDELSQLWRAIAFMPARTVEGVLAKLDAASDALKDGVLDLEDYPKGCAPEEVAWMASADLAALHLTEA